MKNKLTCYAKLLIERFAENGCTLIKQSSFENNIIINFKRNNIATNIVDHIMINSHCRYRLELGKENIKILLYEE